MRVYKIGLYKGDKCIRQCIRKVYGGYEQADKLTKTLNIALGNISNNNGDQVMNEEGYHCMFE
jgi:hypothetical protein